MFISDPLNYLRTVFKASYGAEPIQGKHKIKFRSCTNFLRSSYSIPCTYTVPLTRFIFVRHNLFLGKTILRARVEVAKTKPNRSVPVRKPIFSGLVLRYKPNQFGYKPCNICARHQTNGNRFEDQNQIPYPRFFTHHVAIKTFGSTIAIPMQGL